MIWKTTVTDMLKLDYPIIQAPMLGVTTPEMVAAVSNEGGLGSLPVGGLSPEITRELIQKTRALTNKPFAVNLFAHKVPTYNDSELEPMRTLLMQLAKKRGYGLTAADLTDFKLYTYRDQVDILVEEGISMVSFTFGCLDRSTIQVLKNKGCTLAGTATCVEEALVLQEEKIDMIVVQGIEAGGHRGTFIDTVPLPRIGLFSLLPRIRSITKLPCIAAGGINSAQTIKAALDLGADAVQIGTAFIGTEESQAIASYRKRLEQAKDTDTTLTRAFSGRWARGIKNEFMEEIEAAGIPIPPYPLQNSLTAKLRKLAQQAGDSGYTTLWAGQSAGGKAPAKAREVIRQLINEFERFYNNGAAMLCR